VDRETNRFLQLYGQTNTNHELLQIFGGGVALAAIACIPDYPWYNRHPEKWLPATRDRDRQEIDVGTKKRRDR
jgi:Microsomal signal peptidase 12 kDa subunit (SPC12)